jgi:hypothetical protein
MEKNKEVRNKPKNSQLFWQGHQEHIIGERIVSLMKDVKKLVIFILKMKLDHSRTTSHHA